jgi:hypothetical protein
MAIRKLEFTPAQSRSKGYWQGAQWDRPAKADRTIDTHIVVQSYRLTGTLSPEKCAAIQESLII